MRLCGARQVEDDNGYRKVADGAGDRAAVSESDAPGRKSRVEG